MLTIKFSESWKIMSRLLHYGTDCKGKGTSVQALTEAYADSESELVLISGSSAVHAFDKFYEEGRAVAQNAVWQYLETHLTTEEEESE